MNMSMYETHNVYKASEEHCLESGAYSRLTCGYLRIVTTLYSHE